MAAAIPSAVAAAAVAARPAITAPRIDVSVTGRGPDVILIPGLASSRDVWAQTVAALRGGYRFHLVQVGGFAGAPASGNARGDVLNGVAEAVADYIAANRLRQPALVGHSMGGEIALLVGLRHPDFVGRITVVEALPFAGLLTDPAATARGMEPAAARMRASFLAAPAAEFAAGQAASAAQLVEDSASRTTVQAWSRQSDRGVLAQSLYELLTTDLRPALSGLRPALSVIYALGPAADPSPGADRLFHAGYAAARHVRFLPIAGGRHFIMLDQPGRFRAGARQHARECARHRIDRRTTMTRPSASNSIGAAVAVGIGVAVAVGGSPLAAVLIGGGVATAMITAWRSCG